MMREPKEWDLALHAAPGTRFVTPDEYRDGKRLFVQQGMALSVLADALADAADEDGVITDFSLPVFYATHVKNVMRDEEDDEGFELTYDRFTAVALMEMLNQMVLSGLLGHRGKGGSYDYRLALPSAE
jgi:hypothetical protein